MKEDTTDSLVLNIPIGSQVNYAADNATINAYQNITIDASTFQKKLSSAPIKNSCFVGRNDEEDEIIESLLKNHKVFINGVGGIGKTALAKKIYFDYESKYKHIAWIEFKGSWAESLISSLFTVNFNFSEKNTEDEKYEKIFQFLSNLKGNILIIVDNFNSIDSGDLFEIFKLTNADILITSRCQPVGIPVYRLNPPSKEECKRIFKENYFLKDALTFEEDLIIEDIINRSQRYTLAIELISKSICYTNKSISEFWDDLKAQNYQLKELNLQANSDWNNRFINEDISSQISKVYELAVLTDEEKTMAQLLSILPPFSKILLSDLKCWVPFSCTNTIVVLSNKGWVTCENREVYMHEIISSCISEYNSIAFHQCELLMADLERKLQVGPQIDTVNCVKYADYIYNIIRLKKEDCMFCRHLSVKEAALVFKEVGKYDLSKGLLDIIISCYQDDADKSKLILAELYNNYSKIYSMESDIPTALKMAQRAESLIDSINNDCSPNYYFQKMIIKKTVGMHFAHLKNNEEALEKLREAIEISNNVNESQKHQIANLYSDYSLLLYDTGDICGSINTYRKVIQLYDECGIIKHSPWRNTTYTNYADSLILNSQYEDAIYYEFCALLGKYRCYNEDNLAIANALLGMGHIYRAEKRLWDIAAVFYLKAANIYKMVSSVCDGYCDSIVCLAMVTENHELPLKIYEIIMSNTTKVYSISTLVNVMCSLKEFYPNKMILMGEKVIDILKSFEGGHIAEQLIYALMGETYYKLDEKMKAKEYLLKSINKRMIPTSYYYKESIKILSKIPSMIDETALGD